MRTPPRSSIIEEIQDWELALASGDPSARAQFAAWIRRSPEHLHAYLQLLSLETELQNLDPRRQFDLEALLSAAPQNVIPLASVTLPRQLATRTRWVPRLWFAVAASILVLAVSIGFGWWNWQKSASFDYRTALGEQRRVTLPDGSIVELNTQTHLRVSYSHRARKVELLSGEAFFNVQHNAGVPFRVYLPGTFVEDAGTQFTVYRKPDDTSTVAVLDGQVQLSAGEVLKAGQGVRVSGQGAVIARTKINVSDVAAWREHRVWFQNAPLQAIATEFNRYNAHRIIVDTGSLLESKHYTATWDPYDPQSFLSYIRSDPTLVVEDSKDQSTIKRAMIPRN